MSIFTDNFDSYNNGDLNGQGSWSGDTDFDVQESIKNSGTKGISCSVTGKAIAKTGTLTADGEAFAYFRTNADSGSWFDLWEGANQITYARFNHASGRGKLQASLAGSYEDVPGSITNDAFNKVTVQWRSSDKKVRWSLNDGTFTDWKTTFANFSSGLDKIRLVTADVSVGGCCYFDDINVVVSKITCPKGVLAISPKLPTATANITMSLPKGTLTISPKLPTTLLSTIINAVKGTITLSGKLPTATAALAITAVKGTLSLIGSLPTIYSKWTFPPKHTSTYTEKIKNATNWSFKDKQ
jgi:hypothetical protein